MSTQQPTREQVVQWMEHSGIRAFDNQIVCKVGNVVSLARADLEATIAEQSAEIERLKEEGSIYKNNNSIRQENDQLRQQLAETRTVLANLVSSSKISRCYFETDWNAAESLINKTPK